MVRTLLLAVSSVLLLGASDLTEARRAAAEAGVELAEAQAELTRLAGIRNQNAAVVGDLVATYDRLSLQSEELGLRSAAVTEELRRAEASLRAAVVVAEDAVVEAYMGAVVGRGAGWLAANPGLAVAVGEVLAAGSRAARSSVAALASERETTARHRNELGASLVELAAARAATEDARSQALAALMETDSRIATRLAEQAGLESDYRAAQDRLARAERRAAALAGVAAWRDLVARHFPAELVDDALAVMSCESRGDPDAINAASGASGLFQFMAGTWAWVTVQSGWGGASRFDPEANVAMAAWLVDYSIHAGRGAWSRWSCRTALEGGQ